MALDSLNKITIDISDPLNTQVVHAVQEDIRSRFVEITLVRNGEPLDIPVGAVGVIGLRRPNETYVLYDTDEDGNAAVTFDGNLATCYLRQEALAMAGSMYTSVSIYSSDHTVRLTAFHFMTEVDATAVPSDVIVEHDYINIFQTELDEINTLLGDLSATATTLPAGSDATASYSDGVFSFGIPQGETGGVSEEEFEAGMASKAPVIVDTASGDIVSVSDGAGGMDARSLVVNIEPIQTGSGDPSPSNVRPISGRTGLSVYRTGKNLLEMYGVSENGKNYLSKNIFAKAGFYTLSATGISGNYATYVREAGTEGSYAGTVVAQKANQGNLNFTLAKDTAIMVQWYTPNDSSETLTGKTFQLELGSTASNYSAYSGTTYPVSWQTEAGTVYGGTLNVLSGVLTVDRALLTLDSNIPSGTSGIRNITTVGNAVRFEYYPYRAIGAVSTPLISDKFANASTSAGNPWVCDTGLTSPRMYVCMGAEYTTDALIRQWFASNPTDFVYYIANPQTYQLTPTEVDAMLQGVNNIFSDGGSVSLTYPCDTKLYIERLTAPTEDDMVANANIPNHKYFMVGNSLYYSTAAIAQGAAIIVGTNCTRVGLADALNALA